jgi:hypothetical protein
VTERTDIRKEPDYSCVATGQLAEVFNRLKAADVSLGTVAERCEMDVRDVKKVVEQRKHKTTGIGLADRLLTAIGYGITELERSGDIVVIPADGVGRPARLNAEKMARDEFWSRRQAGGPAPGPQERARRPGELLELRLRILERYT